MQSAPTSSLAAGKPNPKSLRISSPVVIRPKQPVSMTPFINDQQQYINSQQRQQTYPPLLQTQPHQYAQTQQPPSTPTPHQHIMIPTSFLQNARLFSPVTTTFMFPTPVPCVVAPSVLHPASTQPHPRPLVRNTLGHSSLIAPRPFSRSIRSNVPLPMPSNPMAYRFISQPFVQRSPPPVNSSSLTAPPRVDYILFLDKSVLFCSILKVLLGPRSFYWIERLHAYF